MVVLARGVPDVTVGPVGRGPVGLSRARNFSALLKQDRSRRQLLNQRVLKMLKRWATPRLQAPTRSVVI